MTYRIKLKFGEIAKIFRLEPKEFELLQVALNEKTLPQSLTIQHCDNSKGQEPISSFDEVKTWFKTVKSNLAIELMKFSPIFVPSADIMTSYHQLLKFFEGFFDCSATLKIKVKEQYLLVKFDSQSKYNFVNSFKTHRDFLKGGRFDWDKFVWWLIESKGYHNIAFYLRNKGVINNEAIINIFISKGAKYGFFYLDRLVYCQLKADGFFNNKDNEPFFAENSLTIINTNEHWYNDPLLLTLEQYLFLVHSLDDCKARDTVHQEQIKAIKGYLKQHGLELPFDDGIYQGFDEHLRQKHNLPSDAEIDLTGFIFDGKFLEDEWAEHALSCK